MPGHMIYTDMLARGTAIRILHQDLGTQVFSRTYSGVRSDAIMTSLLGKHQDLGTQSFRNRLYFEQKQIHKIDQNHQ